MTRQGTVRKASTYNKLLAALPPNEYQRIFPHLEEVELGYNEKISEAGDMIRHVYFPNSGIISMLAADADDSTLIACLIGREGMAGGRSLLLGARTTPFRAIVQGEGTAMRMKAVEFQKENAAVMKEFDRQDPKDQK